MATQAPQLPLRYGVGPIKAKALVCLVAFLSWSPPVAVAQGDAGAKLLESKCTACHPRTDGGLERIKDSRRTPEGWDMTLVRMMHLHGVALSGDERSVLVKHLADTLGLAPEETADRRYILERRSNMIEPQPDETLSVMCARCHSYALFALQRRTRDDWLRSAHFHLGQYPTTEYQALARDRNWWETASGEVVDLLAEYYPRETPAWSTWQSREPVDLSGEWRVTGHQPGRGGYQGVMQVAADGADQYDVDIAIEYADGEKVGGSGRAIVYTGYEWRARIELAGESVLQVAALDKNATGMSGRWFLEDQDVIGADLKAARADAAPRIMAVYPSYLKAGQGTEIAVHGTGLEGDVNLGEGVLVVRVKSKSPSAVVVEAVSAAGAAPGPRAVTVGDARAEDAFTLYSTIDSVRVEPAEAIARVGGNKGPLPPVPAQFDAVAYLNGADGEPGTDDDIRIGVMPATWSVDNNTEVAEQLNDKAFAGSIDPASGLFTPAGAGPNPERPYSTNNAGDLLVKATVTDEGRQVEGSAHLVVTVQRWIDPPIR